MSYSCVNCGEEMSDDYSNKCSDCTLADLYDQLDNASLSGSDNTDDDNASLSGSNDIDDDSNSSANFCYKCRLLDDNNDLYEDLCEDLCEDCSKIWFYPRKCATCSGGYVFIDDETSCENCRSKACIPTEIPYSTCLNCGTSLKNLGYFAPRCCYSCEYEEKQQSLIEWQCKQ